MEISIAQLTSGDALDLPCFRFSGNAVKGEGGRFTVDELRSTWELAARPFAANIPTLVPLASSERLRPEFRRQSTIILPEVVFDCDPRPQAFTIVQERGLVQVNSGFFLTAVMLARTISWLLDLMDSSERFTIDELLSIEIPTDLTRELNRLLSHWRSWDATGVADIAASLDECPPNLFEKIEPTIWDMCGFVFHHEFSHWYRTILRPDVWKGYQDRTFRHLDNWCAVREDPFVSPEDWQQIREYLSSRPAVRASWAEELQCDLMSLRACIPAFGEGGTQRAYVAQSILYGLILTLQDYYYSNMAGRSVGSESHPPPFTRWRLAAYIDAKELGLTLAQYSTMMSGSGTVAMLLGMSMMVALGGATK